MSQSVALFYVFLNVSPGCVPEFFQLKTVYLEISCQIKLALIFATLQDDLLKG